MQHRSFTRFAALKGSVCAARKFSKVSVIVYFLCKSTEHRLLRMHWPARHRGAPTPASIVRTCGQGGARGENSGREGGRELS